MKTLVALLVYLVKTQKLSDQFIQLSFEFRDFYYLNVTRLGTIFVDDKTFSVFHSTWLPSLTIKANYDVNFFHQPCTTTQRS